MKRRGQLTREPSQGSRTLPRWCAASKARRLPTRLACFAIAAAVAGALALHARGAHAYSFVDEVPEDPCARARAFDPQDSSRAAMSARRACRLASFEQRMADERGKQAAAQEEARDAAVQKWVVATQPSRVLRPMAIELFGGSGIANYGLVFSWDVVKNVELAARVGQRQMSCADANFGTGDCTRTTWGAGARWIMTDRDFSPFIGTAFSSTSAPLKIIHTTPEGGSEFLDGSGNAQSLSGSAGIQLATGYVRLSLEYLYEYVFYTGANVKAVNSMPQPKLPPSEPLRTVWEESLNQDKHGVRFQVGIAF